MNSSLNDRRSEEVVLPHTGLGEEPLPQTRILLQTEDSVHSHLNPFGEQGLVAQLEDNSEAEEQELTRLGSELVVGGGA